MASFAEFNTVRSDAVVALFVGDREVINGGPWSGQDDVRVGRRTVLDAMIAENSLQRCCVCKYSCDGCLTCGHHLRRFVLSRAVPWEL